MVIYVRNTMMRFAMLAGCVISLGHMHECLAEGSKTGPVPAPLRVQGELDATQKPLGANSTYGSPLPWSLAVAASALVVLGLVKSWQHSGRLRTLSETPALRVVGRTMLGTRHALYVVRLGSRNLLIGTGTQGPPALMGQIDEEPAGTAGAVIADVPGKLREGDVK